MREASRLTTKEQCIHTKNIFSLIDLSEKDKMYDFLVNHEKKCTQCSTKLKKFKEDNFAVKVYVPKPFMPKDMRESFNREVSDLFKVAGLNEVQNQKNKIKYSLKAVDTTAAAIIEGFISKKMFKGYGVALLVFVALKYFL